MVAASIKPRCYIRKPYREDELAYQMSCYAQFLVVPYKCPHCDYFHLLFVRD